MRLFRAVLLGALALSLVSCGATRFIQEEELKLDSSVVPDDMANQFAVSKTAAPASAADPGVPPVTDSPAPVTESKGKGKRRKGKAAPVAAAPQKKGKGKKGAKQAAAAPAAPEKKEFEPALRRNGKLPFKPGERTVLSLTYFGVEAGTLDLRVLPYKYIGDRKVVHIRGHGASTSVFAMVYKVDDVGDSYMDYDGLFAHKLQLKVNESARKQDLLELYDQRKQQVYYWERLVHDKKGLRITQFTKEIVDYTQDAVTAAFYLRTLPLEVGKEYSYPMVSNGRVWNVTAKVLRREMLTTEKGVFPALVIQPETRFEGVLSKAGDSFFWISDDEHRSFLKIDAKIKVGKVIAYLKELEYGKDE